MEAQPKGIGKRRLREGDGDGRAKKRHKDTVEAKVRLQMDRQVKETVRRLWSRWDAGDAQALDRSLDVLGRKMEALSGSGRS